MSKSKLCFVLVAILVLFSAMANMDNISDLATKNGGQSITPPNLGDYPGRSHGICFGWQHDYVLSGRKYQCSRCKHVYANK